MTLFTYSSFPRRYPLLDRLWDCMLVGRGLKYMLRVALSILYLSQGTLLECDFEGIIFYLKYLPDDGILNPGQSVRRTDEQRAARAGWTGASVGGWVGGRRV